MRNYIRRIMLAVNHIDGLYEAPAKDAGVKSNTLNLLYALDDGQAHTQKSICEQWLIPKTTLNTIIKECEAAGYLTLSPVAGTRRELEICLTASGKALAAHTLGPVYAAEDAAMQQTLQQCSPQFIADLELFCKHLDTAFLRLRGQDNLSQDSVF